MHQAPEVLCGLRPCWMMSPLQVAEMIPADTQLFDVVIFDEASQIPPAEAIGTLARAKQAIVAGDDRQLPPTNFFRGHEPDEDDDPDDDAAQYLAPALIANIESILDVVKALPIREQMLRWHYRSRDGRLIAFSNNQIYGEALTAFPGTVQESPITFHQLDLAPTLGRSTRSHPEEVKKVVDLILDHARRHPGESLGVIAFGSHHADNIEEGLRRRLSAEGGLLPGRVFRGGPGRAFLRQEHRAGPGRRAGRDYPECGIPQGGQRHSSLPFRTSEPGGREAAPERGRNPCQVQDSLGGRFFAP